MKYKKWNFTAPARPEVMAMAEAGLPVLAALVLCARGVDTPEKARAFLAVDGLPLTAAETQELQAALEHCHAILGAEDDRGAAGP